VTAEQASVSAAATFTPERPAAAFRAGIGQDDLDSVFMVWLLQPVRRLLRPCRMFRALPLQTKDAVYLVR
jgi:hypothetical protein